MVGARAALLLAATALGAWASVGLGKPQNTNASRVVSSSIGELDVQRLATLEYPWGLALLPDGRILVTEKPGRLRLYADGKLSEPIRGVPDVVYRGDQGGLLDVVIDPGFARNQLVYLSYVEAAEQQPAVARQSDEVRLGNVDRSDTVVRGGAVARGRLVGNELRDVEVIWRQVPKTMGRGHFGHRLQFAPDGTLFITSGERMRFEVSQDLSTNLGKVVRINPDGSIPRDNPFVRDDEARDDIWSYGHRNMLAIAIDPATEHLWVAEMGPRNGDELNLVRRGENYGWPIVSNGEHYGRPSVPREVIEIPDHDTTNRFVPPVRTWTPVISPSGALFYSGALFREWLGDLLLGGLSSKALIRLSIEGDRVVDEERIDMGKRIRDVLELRDGSILVIVDDERGDLLRLTPRR